MQAFKLCRAWGLRGRNAVKLYFIGWSLCLIGRHLDTF